MWKSDKGYSLAESLVALTCVLLLMGSLFPLLFHQYATGANRKRELESARVLLEEVEDVLLTSSKKENAQVVRGEEIYVVNWERENKGVCVKNKEVVVCVQAE
ncbi:type II secretion system protein [Bacillus sp. 2205SS5-2]|uniref:type II secretion system protein n=1 Tax=Bacillus sp. 2205SS5-2 TaxID=3109031 RepID=UPI003006F85D